MNQFPSKNKGNSEDATGLLFMRTYNKWHGEIKKQLNKIGVTHPQFVVLTTIGYMAQYEDEITQVMVATLGGMDVMSVSQVLTLLEKKGLVHRQAHSKDTRANAIGLTEAGIQTVVLALPIVEKIDISFFSALGEDESIFKKNLHLLNSYEFDTSNR